MKIVQFRSKRLHGYLTFVLEIQPDLTFLTGINGSGKTSAVRAMTALLTPSLLVLSNMEYEYIAVTVLHDEKTFSIESQRTDEELEISISGIEDPFRIPVLKPQAYEPRNRFTERQREFYREQATLRQKNPVLSAIEDLPTPMFLDLERRDQEGTRTRRDPGRLPNSIYPANPLAGSLLDSLTAARALAEGVFRGFLARRTELTDQLKHEIILAAFRISSEDDEVSGITANQALLKKVDKNERLLNQSLSQIGIADSLIAEQVGPFFSRVRELTKEFSEKRFRKALEKGDIDPKLVRLFQDWSALRPQIRQVNDLAKRIDRYNVQISQQFEPLQRYLTSVNGFLADSSKTISFDGSGNLMVLIEGDKKARPVNALSSGERQLVVILTHLAFNQQAKTANILIIDEPELSLHLRWQELFVDAITAASPGLQCILATHSPSIIKGRSGDCIDVEEARRNDRLLR